MSASISNLSGDKRIILGDDRFARPPSFMQSGSWQKLRIGLRLCMSDSGANATSSFLHIGICAGTSAIMGDATPAHWFGLELVGNFNVYQRFTSPTRYLCPFISGYNVVNGVQVSGHAASMETVGWQIGATDTNRTLFFLDIAKGSPDYTVSFFRNTGTACTDVDAATFLSLVSSSSPSLTDHSFTTPASWAVNEATEGQFTAVNVSWNHSNPVFKISELAVVRLA